MLNQDYRGYVLLTKPEHLSKVFRAYLDDKDSSYAEIKQETSLSSGYISDANHDMITMRIMSNGNGMNVTELGKELMRHEEDSKEFKQVLKRAALNAPIFKATYDQFGKSRSSFTRDQIQEYFLQRLPDFERRDVLKAVRRYFEYIFEEELPRAKPIRKKRKIQGKNKSIFHPLGPPDEPVWSRLQNEYELNSDDIYRMISTLPIDKKDRVLAELLKTVFKN